LPSSARYSLMIVTTAPKVGDEADVPLQREKKKGQ
jgi:hypothetical protein